MKKFACILIMMLAATAANAREIGVDSAQDIRSAIASARPGDTIIIKPGEYDMGSPIRIENSGQPDKPITLRADGDRGYAKLSITGNGSVGFRIQGSCWLFEGVHFEGNAKTKDLIQVTGENGTENLKFVNCKMSKCSEFLIKASRSRESGAGNVILEHCEWFDSGHTALDLVSGDGWVVRNNYVHDYGKDGGVSYGIFLKGGGKNGLIEGNIVDGKSGKTTVGISFGGGSTGEQWMPLASGGKIAPEHTGGICRNNIVINTRDVAYHSFRAAKCLFANNLAINCGAGYQMQESYPPDPAVINNVLSGRIRGGNEQNNLTSIDASWFVDPGQQDFRLTDKGIAAFGGKGKRLSENPVDFFGQKRGPGDASSLGPVNAQASRSTQWRDARAGER